MRHATLGLLMSLAVLSCNGDRATTTRTETALDVLATHTPMHPATGQAVTLKAIAKAKKIRLKYERFKLEAQADGTLKQTSVESKEAQVCEADAGVEKCEHAITAGFEAGSLIRFEAVAESATGGQGTETYFFAAGDYPLPDAPVPIRLKTGIPGGLDLVFIGTADLQPAALRVALGDVVEKIYFEKDPLKSGRGVYNFYYATKVGDYDNGCKFTDPDNMDVLEATGDAVVFLHRADKRDCKTGKRISSEVSNKKSMVHESGHILFDLQDEYCCDSSYAAQACVPNLWSSLQGCEGASTGLGYPKTACTRLEKSTTKLDFWRIDPATGDPCIMGPGQHEANSWFRTACERRIQWRHEKCRAGTCFTSPKCP